MDFAQPAGADEIAAKAERLAAPDRQRRIYGPAYLIGSYVKVCPPIAASYIRPPLAMVNTATPCSYAASADAPAVTATAEACAENSKRSLLKRSKALLF